MKYRLIAVALIAAASVVGVPTVASASTGQIQKAHFTKTLGPDYCC
jgi:hypothetical protein